MDPTLQTYLQEHNLLYKEFTHPAVFTVAESDKIKTSIPGIRSKNLFFKSREKFYLYTLPAEQRLDTKALKKYLNIKHLEFGSPEELKVELHLTPGSVSIFGMIYSKNTILLIDKQIWNAQEAGFHPNVNTATLVITHEELEKFCRTLKASWEVVDIA